MSKTSVFAALHAKQSEVKRYPTPQPLTPETGPKTAVGPERRVAYALVTERRGSTGKRWRGSTSAAVVAACEAMTEKRANGGYAYAGAVVHGPARSVVSEAGMTVSRESGSGWRNRISERLSAGSHAALLERERRVRSRAVRREALGAGSAGNMPTPELRPESERLAWLAANGLPEPRLVSDASLLAPTPEPRLSTEHVPGSRRAR